MLSNALIAVCRIPCDRPQTLTLSLTAEERTRSHHRFDSEQGIAVFLRLPRGTVLEDGDCLAAKTGEIIGIKARAEEVLTVKAESRTKLLQVAYHLGNRHVALEIAADHLRLLPDPVLEKMLEQLGAMTIRETAPFSPETGAYRHVH
jgi:urease accessory protein